MFRKNSVMIKWLISYICIMAVVLSVMVMNFNIMKSDLAEEITYSHQNMLSVLQNSMDNCFDLQERIYLQLAINSDVEKVLQSKGEESAILNYRILQQIKSMLFSNQSIEDIIICFYDKDLIISKTGASDCRTMHDLLFENSNYDEWISSMKKNYTGERVVIDTYKGNQKSDKQIAYIKSIPFTGNLNAKKATVMVLVSEEFFYKQAENFSNGGTLVKLMDEEGVSLLETKNELDVSDEDIVKYVASSNVNGWKFSTFTPKNIYWKQINTAWRILILMMLLAIILGTAMIVLMLKRQYNPIAGLLKHLYASGASLPSNGQNEFDYIKSAIASTIGERDKIIKKQKSQLVQNTLSRLVKNDGGMRKENYEKLNISSPSDSFMIILFFVRNPNDFFVEEKDIDELQRRQLLFLVVSNIMSEVLLPYGESYFFEVDGFVAALLAVKSENAEEKEIKNALEDGSHELEKHFNVFVEIMMSNIHKNIESLPISYQEAYDTWEYMELLGKNGILSYSDIGAREAATYYYPTNKENQLINIIKSGDKEEMIRLLEEIFYENIEKNACPLKLFKYLLIDIMSTVLKLSAEIKDDGQEISDTDYLNNLLEFNGISEGKEKVINFASEVCDKIKESMDATKRNIGEEVKKYISVHYNEQNLNIGQIGDAFNIKPYYLSKQFKQETGEGLINYIHRYRVEKSKELILSNNMKLEEVARRVGFLDAKTLIRSFKSIEGITPGAFKEISNKKKQF